MLGAATGFAPHQPDLRPAAGAGRSAHHAILNLSLSRSVGPLERDGLVKIGAGPDGRTRSITLTTTGEARLKTATVHWRRAQREFELAVGVGNAAGLRTVLRRVISVT